MTAIKTVAVTSKAHMSNLARYLDDDRALARESQHIVNEKRWAKEMERTRRAFGHDAPARKGAKNTVAYHQVIAFLPEEGSINGGKMTPKACMAFAREWIETRYPNQEACWALHEEACKADGSRRFAVHICINRTDLTTGKRLDEGPARFAKVERANAMRDMDRRWGLSQLRANERNSAIHARQPTKGEKMLAAQGGLSDKEYIRQAIRSSAKSAASAPVKTKAAAFSEELAKRGVGMARSGNGKDLTFARKRSGFRVNGVKLGRGFSPSGLKAALGVGLQAAKAAERAMGAEMER